MGGFVPKFAELNYRQELPRVLSKEQVPFVNVAFSPVAVTTGIFIMLRPEAARRLFARFVFEIPGDNQDILPTENGR